MARTLLLLAVLFAGQFSHGLDAQQAHELIKQQKPDLLGDGSQLVSLYYFGHSADTSIVGLERVGEDYLPIRWLLIFNGEKLLGWYYPAYEFPAKFDAGYLIFPQGAGVKDVYLWPAPPPSITIGNTVVPFYETDKQIN
ncbi:hypothetical protein A9Q73_08445 [Bermanella sp. 47_1433_sub80_T6]|nr:hypothetical protein A9Q73_08445 [Bermanella sp. 47_1433_sub80_T6]